MKEHTTRREPLIKRPRRHIHHRLPAEPDLRASRLPEPATEAQPQPEPAPASSLQPPVSA